MNSQTKTPSLMVSLIPVLFLMIFLVINILVFGDDATGGANQLALMTSGVLASLLGIFLYKQDYQYIEEKMLKSIGMAMQANLILLIVGSLIGLWILSGIVPAMIYYGLKLIHPSVFLPVSCIVCCIVSLATGSSWSTAGTVGIALIGIGQTLGIPIGMVGGAIVSGAYFGDKMSPLSDTTNLAPAMSGTDIFTHIRHMLYTSGPSIIISVILFSILGFFNGGGDVSDEKIATVVALIDQNFSIGPHLFIAPLIVLILVIKKIPALPALVIGALLGAIFALIFQGELLSNLSGGEFSLKSAYQTIIKTSYAGFEIETDNKLINKLFNRGGMSGMLSTVWLIIMAMVFGGSMEATGFLEKIASSILRFVHGSGSLIGATLGSCLFLNMTACDQYLAIVVPGRMFKNAYDQYGLHPKNLSRALEDSATVTSCLIPWNTGGAYMSGVLGMSTYTYLPYAFFNLLSPVISAFLAGFNLTIERIEKESEVA